MRFKFHSENPSTLEWPDSFGILSVDDVYRACKTQEPAAWHDARLICLRCGAENEPDSQTCQICDGGLIVPNRDTGFRFRAAAQSSIGRERPDNKDVVGLWALNGVVLAMVADGMSGAVAGEIASCMVRETIQLDLVARPQAIEDMQTLSDSALLHRLEQVVTHANETLLECVQNDPALEGMGSALTLALLRGKQLFLVHIGSTRAYLVDAQEGAIRQLTRDHTLVQAMVDTDAITESQAAAHPMRFALYRAALGQKGERGQPDALITELQAGDRVILCSNGLPRHVKDYEIAARATRLDNPEKITRALIDLTLERGAEDNVSVVSLMIES